MDKTKKEDFIDFMLCEVEDGVDGEVLWAKIKEQGYGEEDFIRLANVIMMTHQIPDSVRNKLWNNM